MSQRIEFDYYIAPDGTEYKFHNDQDRFLLAFTDMGMPPIEYIEQRGPFQHGVSLIDYRLQKRIIQYAHRRNGCSREDYWNNRSDILDALRPNRQFLNTFAMGKLRKILPYRKVRDIDVIIQEGPSFGARNSENYDEFGWVDVLRFVAPDPTFYDPSSHAVSWVGPTLTQLVFPITFPIQFSSTLLLSNSNIVYVGTWLSYPVITVRGPVGGFTITNTTTGERIEMEYIIGGSETVTINLAFGNKTVTNNSGDNLYSTVTADSDISTFHIAPDPEAAGGVNNISVLGSMATANTLVTLTYLDRYIGI